MINTRAIRGVVEDVVEHLWPEPEAGDTLEPERPEDYTPDVKAGDYVAFHQPTGIHWGDVAQVDDEWVLVHFQRDNPLARTWVRVSSLVEVLKTQAA